MLKENNSLFLSLSHTHTEMGVGRGFWGEDVNVSEYIYQNVNVLKETKY